MELPHDMTPPIPAGTGASRTWPARLPRFGMTSGEARRITAAWLALGICLALTLTTVILAGLSELRTGLPWNHWGLVFWSVVFLTYPIVGVLVVAHQPANRIGKILCITGLVWIGANFAEEYGAYVFLAGGSLPAARYITWVGSFYPTGLWLVLSYLLLIFPTGRAPSRWWRPVAWLGAIGATAGSLQFAFGLPTLINGELGDAANPLYIGGSIGEFMDAIGGGFLLIFVSGMLAVVSMVRRLRSSTGVERQQLKWIAFDTVWIGLFFIVHFSSMVFGFLGEYPGIFFLWSLSLASLPVVIGIAVLRFHLFDIDVVINRALVYLGLSACVILLYLGLVGGLSVVLHGAAAEAREPVMISLLVTGLIAVLFQPMRDYLQRAVNRFFYGERDDPYAVISRLGERLEATLAPSAVLPAIVQTVAEALKLPYAAIELPNDQGTAMVVAATGMPGSELERFPLVYRHERMGELVVAPRAAGDLFTPADRRLLEDLARQAGVAVHAVRLTDDLQRARERLVTAREEERRRLRRDLHDGLGAQLAALTVQAGALRQLISHQPEVAIAEVCELQAELRQAIANIRQLVQGLRPPALDELGLLGALRGQIGRYDRARALTHVVDEAASPDLQVTLDAPDTLPPLPAAVEVAIFRIVDEAVTNVVRHAEARLCQIRIEVERGLRLTVADDGVGLAPDQITGVGLVSMRERAIELGGTCTIQPGAAGGTRVAVWLPLREEQG